MHSPAEFEAKTRLTAAERIALDYAAKRQTRSAANLQRHLILEHLRQILDDLPADVRAALATEWDS